MIRAREIAITKAWKEINCMRIIFDDSPIKARKKNGASQRKMSKDKKLAK